MNMMNLYLIERFHVDDCPDYDEFAGFVIAAETEWVARRIAADRSSGEGREIWLGFAPDDGNYYKPVSSIKLIASDVSLPEGVVLADYRAG